MRHIKRARAVWPVWCNHMAASISDDILSSSAQMAHHVAEEALFLSLKINAPLAAKQYHFVGRRATKRYE